MTAKLVFPDGTNLEMITRDEWGARGRNGTTYHGTRNDYKGIVGHHTAGSFPETIRESMADLRAIQAFHMDGKGWTDFAYNVAVDGGGRLYEGRGFSYQNGANFGTIEGVSANSNTISIVYLGNTERHPFTVEAAATISRFKDYLETPVSACPGGCGLWGHRDVSPTTCPGSKMYAFIQGGAEKPC